MTEICVLFDRHSVAFGTLPFTLSTAFSTTLRLYAGRCAVISDGLCISENVF